MTQDRVIGDEGANSDVRSSITRVAFVASGILILTSVLFPVPADPGNYSEFLSLMVENSGRTQAVLLAVPIGIWALAVGVLTLNPMLRNAWSAAMVQSGAYLMLIGAGAVTVQFGVGNAALAEASGNSLDAGGVLWAGATHIRSFAMLAIWIGLGLAGIGLLRGVTTARWMAWTPILLGVVMTVASIAAIVDGPTKTASTVTGGVAGLTALWAIILGLRLKTFA